MTTRRAATAFALALGCAWPTSAEAGVFDIFGFGARAIGMGGAATATADDHTATFYNPANLTRRKAVHLGLSFSAWFHDLGIRQPVPDQPQLVAEGTPESPMGISFGVLFPLGGKIENRIALGLAIYLPVARALRLSALEPATPRWYRYHTLSDKLHVVAAVAGEPFDWLSIGIGFQALAELEGGVDFAIDLTNQEITRRDALVQLVNSVAPIAGIRVQPLDALHFGLSYRGPIQLTYAFPLRFDFGEALDLTVDIEGVDLYTPHTLTFGSALEIAAADLLVALDFELALWSLAPDPTIDVSLEGAGTLVEELGLDEILDVRPGTEDDAAFTDTLTVRVGAEQRPLEWLALRTGYFFRQASAAPQTGSTSYLDSASHSASLGASVTFPDPLEIDERPVIFDLAMQGTFHPETTVRKRDSGNPIGSVTYGGATWGLSVSLRHDF